MSKQCQLNVAFVMRGCEHAMEERGLITRLLARDEVPKVSE